MNEYLSNDDETAVAVALTSSSRNHYLNRQYSKPTSSSASSWSGRKVANNSATAANANAVLSNHPLYSKFYSSINNSDTNNANDYFSASSSHQNYKSNNYDKTRRTQSANRNASSSSFSSAYHLNNNNNSNNNNNYITNDYNANNYDSNANSKNYSTSSYCSYSANEMSNGEEDYTSSNANRNTHQHRSRLQSSASTSRKPKNYDNQIGTNIQGLLAQEAKQFLREKKRSNSYSRYLNTNAHSIYDNFATEGSVTNASTAGEDCSGNNAKNQLVASMVSEPAGVHIARTIQLNNSENINPDSNNVSYASITLRQPSKNETLNYFSDSEAFNKNYRSDIYSNPSDSQLVESYFITTSPSSPSLNNNIINNNKNNNNNNNNNLPSSNRNNKSKIRYNSSSSSYVTNNPAIPSNNTNNSNKSNNSDYYYYINNNNNNDREQEYVFDATNYNASKTNYNNQDRRSNPLTKTQAINNDNASLNYPSSYNPITNSNPSYNNNNNNNHPNNQNNNNNNNTNTNYTSSKQQTFFQQPNQQQHQKQNLYLFYLQEQYHNLVNNQQQEGMLSGGALESSHSQRSDSGQHHQYNNFNAQPHGFSKLNSFYDKNRQNSANFVNRDFAAGENNANKPSVGGHQFNPVSFSSSKWTPPAQHQPSTHSSVSSASGLLSSVHHQPQQHFDDYQKPAYAQSHG
jgi:hypothetical protein